MNTRAHKETVELAGLIRAAHLVGRLELRTRSEYELQKLLVGVLPSYAQAEVVLSGADRIDFLVRCATLPEVINVGVECKVAGSPADVSRQLMRYLQNDTVHGIVLVSTKRGHRTLPDTLCGKPVQTIWLRPE